MTAATLLLSHHPARVERVAEPVADEVDRHDREEDREPREDRDPGRGGHIGRRVSQHVSPQLRELLAGEHPAAMRVMTSPARSAQWPSTSQMTLPANMASIAARTPHVLDTRPPNMMGVARSRPRLSFPIGWLNYVGSKMSSSCVLFGSYGDTM